MSAIAIHTEAGDVIGPRFRAVAGSHQSVGRTAGEALDLLLAQEGQTIDSSMILIQRFAPDAYFTGSVVKVVGQCRILGHDEQRFL